MNLTYDYYLLAHHNTENPAWIKTERYSYCENFSKIFSFFKR